MRSQFGLPFGQVPIWIATLALWKKTREVHFDSAAQMLEFVSSSQRQTALPQATGGPYTSLRSNHLFRNRRTS
jgi:hypothetical protein